MTLICWISGCLHTFSCSQYSSFPGILIQFKEKGATNTKFWTPYRLADPEYLVCNLNGCWHLNFLSFFPSTVWRRLKKNKKSTYCFFFKLFLSQRLSKRTKFYNRTNILLKNKASWINLINMKMVMMKHWQEGGGSSSNNSQSSFLSSLELFPRPATRQNSWWELLQLCCKIWAIYCNWNWNFNRDAVLIGKA